MIINHKNRVTKSTNVTKKTNKTNKVLSIVGSCQVVIIACGKIAPNITKTIPFNANITTSQTLVETIFIFDTFGLISFAVVELKKPELTIPAATTAIIPLKWKASAAKYTMNGKDKSKST